MNAFRTSSRGLAMIKQFEGCRLESYRDSAGTWTIGYGHTGKGVGPGQRITDAEADLLLRGDVGTAESFINQVVTGPLNQNRFDAIVDFTFNEGRGSLLRSSLLAALNQGYLEGAALGFRAWTLIGGHPSTALTRRRAAEEALFRTP